MSSAALRLAAQQGTVAHAADTIPPTRHVVTLQESWRFRFGEAAEVVTGTQFDYSAWQQITAPQRIGNQRQHLQFETVGGPALVAAITVKP